MQIDGPAFVFRCAAAGKGDGPINAKQARVHSAYGPVLLSCHHAFMPDELSGNQRSPNERRPSEERLPLYAPPSLATPPSLDGVALGLLNVRWAGLLAPA